ncbi:hypothetical protein M422DRAFT_275905 [Sphaerobolus stellatus SS14]|uniref:Uncharacterized protein n=1 Tax=Sphaerobolus stellatus (strain SS14) TaxID=990650 RepID=A0A0C9T3P2_SPHS4|nr:hypothetical protein M422DRAFT_275905 [Sphaerobolus stellatus SS14]
MEAGEISGHLNSYRCSLSYLTLSSTHLFSTLGSPPVEHAALGSSPEASASWLSLDDTDLLPERVVVTISASSEPAFCHTDTISIVFTIQAMRSVIRRKQLEQEKATYLKKEWHIAQSVFGSVWTPNPSSTSEDLDISVGRRPSFIEDSTAYRRTSLTQDEYPIRLQQAKIWCSKTRLLIADEPQQHHRSRIYQENIVSRLTS